MLRIYKGLNKPVEPLQESASFLSVNSSSSRDFVPMPPARSTSHSHLLTAAGMGDGMDNMSASRRNSQVRFGQVQERPIPRKAVREFSLQQHPPTPPSNRCVISTTS